MSFLHDKQIRNYCIFLISLFLFVFLAGITILERQTMILKETLLTHDNAIAASLLEQGIPKETIATALTNTKGTPSGRKFLAQIGLSKNTDANLLPYVSSVKNAMLTSILGILLFWTTMTFAGTVIFLYHREQLYQKSENIIQDYINGNYSTHLSQAKEGSVYQMLSSVEQLATILRSKNDTVQKTKDFLKNTISDISNQLKTPLSALMMYQEIIVTEPDNPDTVKEFSVKIGISLKRIEQLI